MVVDVSRASAPRLVAGPLDPRPGESTRELRVWRSKGLLIVLNTNCGVGPTLHQCTVPSISNIRFYNINGRHADAAEARARAEGRHARVLPLGGPGGPRAGSDLRRQRELHLRHARRRAELPVLRLGHLGRARRRSAGDALQRAVPVQPLSGGARAGAEADGRPALADGLQRRQRGVLRAADRRLRDRRRVGVRRRRPVPAAAGDHPQRGAPDVGGPRRAQRRAAVGPRLGVGLRRGLRLGDRRRPRLPVGLDADGRRLRPEGADRAGGVPGAGERPGDVHRRGTRRARPTPRTTRR